MSVNMSGSGVVGLGVGVGSHQPGLYVPLKAFFFFFFSFCKYQIREELL